MKVCGLQLDLAWEDPEENLRRAEVGLAEAGHARLVVLPEMFGTGFSMNSEVMAGHAPRIRGWLSDTAAARSVWLLGGLAEPGASRPRNAAALYGPDGAAALTYHKVHPFSLAREDEHFEGGREVSCCVVDGVRVTPLVCYDLRFPELFRARAAQTDLFVVIANWPEPRAAHWRTLLRARAIENQCYVLGVNRVGTGDKLTYRGDSALYDPLGDAVDQRAWQPGAVSGDVDPARVAEVRARFSFLADRRPEVYGAL